MNEPKHIPDSLEQWLQDDAALPIGPRYDIVDSVNEWIRANPNKELPRDFFMSYMAKVMNEPRTLREIKDEDK